MAADNNGFTKERVKCKTQLLYFLGRKNHFLFAEKCKLANKKMVLLTALLN